MIFHRGREMAHQEVGRAKMTRLLGEIGDYGQIETMPRMEGNVLVALLAPKKGVPVAKPVAQTAHQAQ
jgi:translation initiation factor IF-3